MPNTSATGGSLQPSSTVGAQGLSFEDFLQQVLVQVSGLAGQYVRPRYQQKPPPQPPREADWLGFGITRRSRLVADRLHIATGDGSESLEEHEEFDALISAYGPNADSIQSLIASNLEISQNRDALRGAGVAYADCGQILTTSDLLNEEWVARRDRTLTFRRVIARTYPILNLLSVQGQFNLSDGRTQTFTSGA